MAAAGKTSSSISVDKLYGDNILSGAEYSSPLTISGTANVANTSDTYAVQVVTKDQSGTVVDTFWASNLSAAKNGKLTWSVSDISTAQKLADDTYTINASLFDISVSPTNPIASTASTLKVDTTASVSISPIGGDWGISAAQSAAAAVISGSTVGVEA